jgi:hypothetical protein
MGKTLIPLIAAALSAIVLLVPLAEASTEGPHLECGSKPCLYRGTGGGLELTFGPSRFSCASITSYGTYKTRTTSLLTLTLHQCREQITMFNFSCTSSRQPPEPLIRRSAWTHLSSQTEVPVMLTTSVNFSITCGGFESFRIEGFIVSRLEKSECDVPTHALALESKFLAHGRLKSQPSYDLFVRHGSRKTYKIGTPGRLKFNQVVVLEC